MKKVNLNKLVNNVFIKNELYKYDLASHCKYLSITYTMLKEEGYNPINGYIEVKPYMIDSLKQLILNILVNQLNINCSVIEYSQAYKPYDQFIVRIDKLN